MTAIHPFPSFGAGNRLAKAGIWLVGNFYTPPEPPRYSSMF